MYNDDIRRKKWQKGKFGIPFDMVPYDVQANFYCFSRVCYNV